MTKQSKSSKRWLKEHFNDPYVKRAEKEGQRSRAVYKLQALHEKDHLFKLGMVVIDLGAAPGSWAEFILKKVSPKGLVIAIDLLPIKEIKGVHFIKADVNDESLITIVNNVLNQKKVDFVVSDMAPNTTGIANVDQLRSVALAETALYFALKVLKTGGGLLIKIFQGSGSEEFIKKLRSHFKIVVIRKPDASRARSKEVYLLAKEKRPVLF